MSVLSFSAIVLTVRRDLSLAAESMPIGLETLPIDGAAVLLRLLPPRELIRLKKRLVLLPLELVIVSSLAPDKVRVAAGGTGKSSGCAVCGDAMG